jgi:hypothetical protein
MKPADPVEDAVSDLAQLKVQNAKMAYGLDSRGCAHCAWPKGYEHEELKSHETKKLKVCGRCRTVWYCSSACPTAAWQDHKKGCKVVEAEERVMGFEPEAKGMDALD